MPPVQQSGVFEQFQSDKLAELRVEGDWVSGEDTVAMVKDRLRPMLGANVAATDCITLYFNHHLMQDDALFYADHFMMLPVWVQVLLHGGENADVPKAIDRLRKQATPEAKVS